MLKQFTGSVFLAVLLASLAGCAPSREELCTLPEYPQVESFDHTAVCFVANKSNDPMSMLIYLRLVHDGYPIIELDEFSTAPERDAIDYMIDSKGIFYRDVELKSGETVRDYFWVVDVLPCKNNPQMIKVRYKTTHRITFKDPAEIVPADIARQLNQNLFNTPAFRTGLIPGQPIPGVEPEPPAAPAETPAETPAPADNNAAPATAPEQPAAPAEPMTVQP